MAIGNSDYTDQAMKDHAKTYAGFLRMLKISTLLAAIGVAVVLLIITN